MLTIAMIAMLSSMVLRDLKQRALEAPMESFKSAKQKIQSIHHRMPTVYVEKVNTVTHPLASSIGICRHHTADAPAGSE